MVDLPSFESYRTATLAAGFDEVLERRWDAGAVTDTHGHPFAVTAVLVQGEMWLQQGSMTVHLRPGSGFELAANAPHAERYGAEGALLYTGRRHEAMVTV